LGALPEREDQTQRRIADQSQMFDAQVLAERSFEATVNGAAVRENSTLPDLLEERQNIRYRRYTGTGNGNCFAQCHETNATS
jgi:hypothetical protein